MTMLSVFLKVIIPVVVGGLLRKSRPYQTGKIQLTRSYLQAIQSFRFLVVSLMSMGFLYLLTAFAMVFLFVGLYQVMAPDPFGMAMMFLALGIAFSALVIAGFLWLFSEKRWMEQSGARRMMESALEDLEKEPLFDLPSWKPAEEPRRQSRSWDGTERRRRAA